MSTIITGARSHALPAWSRSLSSEFREQVIEDAVRGALRLLGDKRTSVGSIKPIHGYTA